MSALMKRWQLPLFGRRHLALVETPIPRPGPLEVLVRVRAVALNYRDLLMAEDGMGLSRVLPLVPGSDMCGEIVALGTGVTGFAPGDRVIGTFFTRWPDGIQPSDSVPLGAPGPGMLAEYVVLGADGVVHAPQTLDATRASTLPCSGLTAWYALTETGRTRAGDTVVVIGTGGVALFGVQIARAHGARVVVVSGSDDKLERARQLGATHGINRVRTPDWSAAVREITGGRGADHVLELAGGDNFEQSLSATARSGRVSVIGNLAGDELRSSVYPLLQRGITVQGIGVGHRRALEDFVRAIDLLQLEPAVECEYAFADLQAAFDHLQRGAFGKLVVRVA